MSVCASKLLAHSLASPAGPLQLTLTEQLLGLLWQLECARDNTQQAVSLLPPRSGDPITSTLFSTSWPGILVLLQ